MKSRVIFTIIAAGLLLYAISAFACPKCGQDQKAKQCQDSAPAQMQLDDEQMTKKDEIWKQYGDQVVELRKALFAVKQAITAEVDNQTPNLESLKSLKEQRQETKGKLAELFGTMNKELDLVLNQEQRDYYNGYWQIPCRGHKVVGTAPGSHDGSLPCGCANKTACQHGK